MDAKEFLMCDCPASHLFVGFGLAPSMFPDHCIVKKQVIDPEYAKELIENESCTDRVVPCINPSHALTIGAMKSRFGIDIWIPDRAPIVKLESQDRLLIMGVSGLPRLEGRHEYTEQEINGAKFEFSLWSFPPEYQAAEADDEE